jgi:hypothetical protein
MFALVLHDVLISNRGEILDRSRAPRGRFQQLLSNAPAIFQMFTANLSTPFNFIATPTVEIAARTPVAMEKVTISITGTISAQP